MDDKQNKVLNKINYDSGMTVEIAKRARKEKNDEFYTPMQEISNELSRYGEHFRGKKIICPCDCDVFDDENIFAFTIEFAESSEFCPYSRTFYLNKIKKIKYNRYKDCDADLHLDDESPKDFEVVEITGEDAERFFERRKVNCNFIKYLADIGGDYGVKSITASGYNVETNRGIKYQDVEYSDFDICITNPPFSMYGDFMKVMMSEVEKRRNTNSPFDFILLAPFLNRVTPNVGLNLMLKKCYLGYGRKLRINFSVPNRANEYTAKLVACDWITTFPDAQEEVDANHLHTGVSYEQYKDEFYEMELMTMRDGTHPIKIKEQTVIPDDYYGWMFGSVGILDKLSTREFEWYGTNFKGYYNKEHPETNPFNHLTSDGMVTHNGVNEFHGIVFRRRKQN